MGHKKENAGSEIVLNLLERSVTVHFPAARFGQPSVYAFGIHKSGSTLLNQILALSAPYSRHVFYSFDDDIFLQGVEASRLTSNVSGETSAFVSSLFARDGYIFGGFRSMPQWFEPPALAGRKKILLIRDPRDAVVSLFYSLRYSHIAPEGTPMAAHRENAKLFELNEYVLRPGVKALIKFAFESYSTLPAENLLVLRYEDVIFDKLGFVNSVLDHLDISVPQEIRARVARDVDIVPETERPEQHVRRVRPGDHKEKLSPATIDALNAAFHEILVKYGYL